MRKVVFIDVVHNVLRQRLEDKGFVCIDLTSTELKGVLQEVKSAFGIVIRSRFTLDETILSHASNLKFIARSGSGTENIDAAYCAKKGILLFSSPEGNRNAVAEHALGFLLSLLNNFHKAQLEISSGLWQRKENTGRELSSCTVGIIGCGNNGLCFAKKLVALGASVLVYDKYKTIDEQGVENVSLEAFYTRVNVLSFHVPETEETIGLGDYEFFSRFHEPLFVLNICRGKVINTKGLVRSMKEQRVVGAALDVLEYESKSFESFFESKLPEAFVYLKTNPNVILTPHVAGWTNESYFGLSNVLADKIIASFT
ncbi:phosphoglycerate dehydrogenase [Crocinitomicaceae bacterium]|jgi:D-3-phosphoglycerate dehydrogenase|nr:phosphoglycerate dehydrogenase [Crocinitomicaceae bacterium]